MVTVDDLRRMAGQIAAKGIIPDAIYSELITSIIAMLEQHEAALAVVINPPELAPKKKSKPN